MHRPRIAVYSTEAQAQRTGLNCRDVAQFLILLTLALAACGAEPPPHLRQGDAPLAPCPHRPNCVYSLAADAEHHIEPLQYAGAAQHAREALVKLVESMPGGKVMQASGDYVRAEFTSARMKFVDDVEFLIPGNSNVIQVRSASRARITAIAASTARGWKPSAPSCCPPFTRFRSCVRGHPHVIDRRSASTRSRRYSGFGTSRRSCALFSAVIFISTMTSPLCRMIMTCMGFWRTGRRFL